MHKMIKIFHETKQHIEFATYFVLYVCSAIWIYIANQFIEQLFQKKFLEIYNKLMQKKLCIKVKKNEIEARFTHLDKKKEKKAFK